MHLMGEGPGAILNFKTFLSFINRLLVLFPGKFQGWRSLVGCSPWDHWESDMTEWLHFHFSLECIGEGNGNPLQCSCLENPRGGGAWWAAAYGVAQSRTWLKRRQQQQQSVNERKECLKTQNGTRPLTHKMHFGIILAPNGSSWAIKWLTWIL